MDASGLLRPQSLMLTFLGEYVLGRGMCVFSGSIIDVFERLDVSEHATRSTLARMVNRGLLRRQRHGRRMYFGLTGRSAEVLRDGGERIWKNGAVNHDWDGSWTLLGFSLPESWQRQRHDLRSQLTWAGFGPLQGGLWIAPGPVAVDEIVAGLGLAAHVRVFRAQADPLTDVAQMIKDAYDLDEVARRYVAFLDRWGAGEPGLRKDRSDQRPPGDPLRARLFLVTEWLQVIRRDPRLPLRHLPADWPAAKAQQVFQDLQATFDQPARHAADALLDLVPDATAP